MDPLTLMAGATIGSSLIGGIGGFFGQKENNQASMEIAQYQNEWNEKMYERQKEDNIAFWNMQNEYNSPKETMKRLVEAGINPRAQNGTSYANAGGINSPNAPMAASYDYKSPLAAFNSFVGVAKEIQEVKLLEEQAKNVKADTLYKSTLGAYTATRDADLLYRRKVDEYYNGVTYDENGQFQMPLSSLGVKPRTLSKEFDIKSKDFDIRSEMYKQQKVATAIAEENQALGIGNGDGDVLSTIMRMFLRYGYRNADSILHYFYK